MAKCNGEYKKLCGGEEMRATCVALLFMLYCQCFYKHKRIHMKQKTEQSREEEDRLYELRREMLSPLAHEWLKSKAANEIQLLFSEVNRLRRVLGKPESKDLYEFNAKELIEKYEELHKENEAIRDQLRGFKWLQNAPHPFPLVFEYNELTASLIDSEERIYSETPTETNSLIHVAHVIGEGNNLVYCVRDSSGTRKSIIRYSGRSITRPEESKSHIVTGKQIGRAHV